MTKAELENKKMEKYENDMTANSGISSFRIGNESIKVTFFDGTTYLYTYESAGRDAVEKMKELAKKGKGLFAFISKHVRNGYLSKTRHPLTSSLVKKKRKELGLSQEELAMRVGVGLRFIRDIEQGKESIRLDKLNQVLNYFGLEVGAVEMRRND